MTISRDIIITNPMHASHNDKILESYTVHRLWEAGEPEALLRDVGPRVKGLIASRDPITKDLMDQLPNLEIIANLGAGYDRVDVETASQRGIVVTNTPGVLDDEVADLTIGLLLATVRQIPQADRYVRAHLWPQAPFPLSATLRGRRVGIVGMGNIGQTIARRLSVCGRPSGCKRFFEGTGSAGSGASVCPA